MMSPKGVATVADMRFASMSVSWRKKRCLGQLRELPCRAQCNENMGMGQN